MNKKIWDYIIVGTGMGGGPIGLKLAQAGYSVLFLEKGLRPTLKGKFAEQFRGDETEVLRQSGRLHEPIYDCTTKRRKKIWPFMGQGVGGSSAIYGMVLERFKASDFASWPISYSDFEKYYLQAEDLFGVRLSKISHPSNISLAEYFRKKGISTYSLKLAHKENLNCHNCQSYQCEQNCKLHAGNRCVDVAVNEFGAHLYTDCEVKKILTTSDNRAAGVIAQHQDISIRLRCNNLILANGALKTPLLLLESGIGNESGLVGKNLMRHYVDLYALKIDSSPKILMTKELGIDLNSDFTLQSFGRLPPADVIVNQLIKENPSLQPLKFIMTVFLKFVVNRRIAVASILEDEASVDNRVWKEYGQTCISYRIGERGINAIERSRKLIKIILKPFNVLFIASAQKNQMLAHVCGTAKMGVDAITSVVDTNNRLHGFENIFIVDASFFPTSGSTNPGLTIAANSLRMADIIIQSKKVKLNDVSAEK